MEKYYEIAKIIFTILGTIRELNNESEIETFDSISEQRKQSVYKNVDKIIKNPDITAEEEHDIWMKQKLKDGWKYGKITDRQNKIHNCIVPYSKLNFYQKLKDQIIIETVKLYFDKQIKRSLDKMNKNKKSKTKYKLDVDHMGYPI